jgi:hypothetical protein
MSTEQGGAFGSEPGSAKDPDKTGLCLRVTKFN